MKRIYTFLLLSLFMWSAAMAEVVSGNCGANGDNLTWTLDTETGALVISGEGAMANYEWNTSPLYYINIVSVEITDGVTTIGTYAFNRCSGLTSLTIPNSVTEIGTYAFSSCSGLTSLTIPNSVTEIGQYAFLSCSGLTSLTISNSVTEIGEAAFSGCSGLTSLTIPNSVTKIGRSAFSRCSGLTSISVAADNPYYDSRNDCNAIIETASNTLVAGCKNTEIPNSVTTIGDGAFGFCSGLTSLTIPNSVTTIGQSAFNSCSGLTSLTMKSATPPSTGSYVFNYCDALTTIYVPVGAAANYDVAPWNNYNILEGAKVQVDNLWYNLYFKNQTAEVINSGTTGEYSGSIVIPGSISVYGETFVVTAIGESAFFDCSGLTSLTISNSVTEIGEAAFSGCSGLTSLSVVGDNPYYDSRNDCNAIIETASNTLVAGCKNTVIPNSVTTIGRSAFYGCSGLTSLTIPNSVTEIGEFAFAYCSDLTSLTMKSATPPSTGSLVFYNCNALTTIYVPAGAAANYNVAPWNSYNIMESTKVQVDNLWYNLYFDNQTAEVTNSGTTGEYSGSIVIPESFSADGETFVVTAIGEDAFYGCRGLTSLTIPNSVTEIGDLAFLSCSGLTSLTIPNSVTTIGQSAFNGCSGLTSISVADDNPYYDSRNDCNAIIETASNTLVAGCKNTVIPNSVTEIGNGAFFDCFGLMNLTIPNSVTTIGDLAFWNCFGLTSLTIPNSVTEIGNCAFYGCSGLTSLTIPNSVTTIGDRAFYDCSGLTSLTIPNSVTTIEFGAFAFCSGLTSISVAADNPYYDSRNDCNAIIETASNTLVAGCKNTEIPNSVTTIGGGAFGGCSGLTSLTIPNSVTKIGDYAFEGCSGLTSLTIPNSVTKIGEYAFRSCSGLTSLTMKSATPPSTGSDVFSYCYDLTTIYVPFGTTSNYDVAPWNSYEIVEALGVVSSNPATGEEVEGLSVITLTFNKEIKSINESLIKLTATSSSTQVPVSVQINATNTKALTITLSQAVYNRDTYVLTLAAGAVAAMDDKSNEEALEMSYVVTTKPLADVDLSKLYRIKDVGTGLYLNAANYDVHEQGTHGGVNAVEKANSDDQVFTLSKDGNNFKLQTASGKYIYCQGWNVDALDEGTALTFVPAEEGAFYIMRGSQYFKIEQVGSVYYPFCDAPESKRAKFVLEEVVRVALTDGEDYTQAAEMEAERITYTRNFKNTYYQPWYVPFDVEYDEIIDRFVVAELNDIHQFDDNNDGEFERWAIEVLQLKRGDVISANHPYMIKARTAGEQSIVVENTTLYPADLNTIDCSSTKMLYTFEPTYTTLSGSVLREEGCYVVGSGKLVNPTDGSVVKANRWYLRPEPRNGGSLLSAPKQIQIFERDENGLTDIETAIEESEQTTWPADVYDLNGRLVRKAATNMDGLNKGMYIVNGKKIVK